MTIRLRPRARRPLAAATFVSLVVVLVAAAGCRRASTAFRGAPVILISVDTLRADHLPAYGYAGVATPTLDALRKDSVLFENAYTHVPLTLPSHAAIMTGLLPPENGVRDNLGYRVAPDARTLAGFFQAAGYATGAAVSSIVLSHTTGMNRGFDFYDDDVEPTELNPSLGRVRREGGTTAASLSRWIESVKSKPVFAFLHLYDTHTPYEPPQPFRSRYPLAYDGAIARTDEVLGEFLGGLKKSGLYDRAIVVFLSDHGEGLGGHGEEEHGVLLYRETLHVPLFVKLPSSRLGGRSVRAPVGLTDVFPTLAALASLDVPKGLSGIALGPHLASGDVPARRIYSETLYPKIHYGWSDLASLAEARYHYIEAPRPELYDLQADPGELKDLSPGLPPAFRSLRAELGRMSRPVQPPGQSDPEQVKKLAALGYISAGPVVKPGEALPDPKDRIGVIEKLKNGFGALKEERFEDARRIFRDLVRENPAMMDVWQLLGQAELRLGNDAEAHRALVEAARLSPGNPQVLLGLSDYFLETGNFAEARRHAELARDAGGTDAHERLAQIAAVEGDHRTAETEARAALALYPNRRIPHLILGRALRDRGDLPGALAELETAKRLSRPEEPPLFAVNFLRGDVLARLGNNRAAEEAFQRELRDFPGSAQAFTGLALLYASEGREAEARRTLERCVSTATTPASYFAVIKAYRVLGDTGRAGQLRQELRQRFPDARERREGLG